MAEPLGVCLVDALQAGVLDSPVQGAFREQQGVGCPHGFADGVERDRRLVRYRIVKQSDCDMRGPQRRQDMPLFQ